MSSPRHAPSPAAEMAAAGFAALMDGKMTPAQAGGFLMGLRMKGESSLELAHATRAALARASVTFGERKLETFEIVTLSGWSR